ncbi:SDR family NAD(P)-dependent oxidoreductase [Streptomyces sp. NPDC090025]|uniref:SDR family NAD(P)-dependent oxidoreductase n=1 Tax=Streptomyces sp. NPDC090025 TaxID=3365922 RepID=UPI00383573E7
MARKPLDSFKDKVVAITGAGSGIGRALAVRLTELGAHLALSDIDAAGVEETARICSEHGRDVWATRLDVTEREAVTAYAHDVRAYFGTVHQLYNNAGVAFYGEVERQSFKDVERVMDVNFWGTVAMTRSFLPYLIASHDGHVVNVSSLFGLITYPGQSAYTASKFAVRGFTETLRQEMLLARYPVKVTAVHPGGVKTAVARNAGAADGLDAAAIARAFDRRLALHSPETAAEAIVRGVHGGRARIVIGAEAKALERFGRLAPVASQRFGAVMSRVLRIAPRPGARR